MGLCTAYYLAQNAKARIALLEKNWLAQASTGLSGGGIRQQFSHPANIRLSQKSLKIFRNFQDEFETEIGFHEVGYLFLAQKEKTWQNILSDLAVQRREAVPVEELSPSKIQSRWPFLEVKDLRGGIFCAQDGYANPYSVAMAFARASRAAGVAIFEQTEVLDIQLHNHKVQGVFTSQGPLASPIVINTAGAWGGEVMRMARLKMPVRPFRRQVYVTDTFKLSSRPTPMIIDQDPLFYFRGEGPRILMGLTDLQEPSSFHTHLDRCFLEKLIASAVHRAPRLEQAKLKKGWAGLYAVTPDNNPIIGRIPGINGLYCAIGFSGHGFQHGPAVGQILSELVRKGSVEFDLEPFAADRFRRQQTVQEKRAV